MEMQFFEPSSAMPVNTLAITKHLRAHGYTEDQAEAQAYLWVKIVDTTLATKRDIQNVNAELKKDIENIRLEIQNVRAELKKDIENLRAELKKDIENVKIELQRDLKDLEYRMTIKLGAMLVIAITAMSAIVKLL